MAQLRSVRGKKRKFLKYLSILFILGIVCCQPVLLRAQGCNRLCNTDFETPQYGGWHMTQNSLFPCWYTTASDSDIEVWWTGFNGVPAYSGNQFIELNAYLVATMYQNFTAPPGTLLNISFAHRGRAGVDTMSVSVGPVGGPYVTIGTYGDGNTAWVYRTVPYTLPSGVGNYFSLRFNSVYSTGGNQSIGNFLDDVSVNLPGADSLAMTAQNTKCFNGSNGTATVTVRTGTGPYTYSWAPSGGTSASASGLAAGIYTVFVTDANGCTALDSITIKQPASIAPTVSSTNGTCLHPGGSATAGVSGGTGTYTYSWSPGGQATSTVTNLAVGTYTIWITDANGCSDSATTTISSTGGVTATLASTNTNCSGPPSGSVTVSNTVGTGPFTYSWNPGGQTTSSISNQPKGVYTVYITDANGCTTKDTISISQPPPIILNTGTVTNTSCGISNGTASMLAVGGTAPFTYSWTPAGGSSSTANGLSPGSYTLTVADAKQCAASDTVHISASAPPVPVTFTGIDTTGCSTLCVHFRKTSAQITCQWNFGDGQTDTASTPTHCYTTPGTYNVQLTTTDSKGCSSVSGHTGMVKVVVPPHAAFSESPSGIITQNTAVQFTDHSTSATSWYWIFGGASQDSSVHENPVYTYMDTGTYIVKLYVQNGTGCKDSIFEFVHVEGEFSIYVPNAFTPNGDGRNDVFLPVVLNLKAGTYLFDVFDRWGNRIFETTEPSVGWDGHANGGKDQAQIDTYVWKIFCQDNSNQRYNLIGSVHLIR